jgi:hypothetical protein
MLPRQQRALGLSAFRWMGGAACVSLASSILLVMQAPDSWIGPVAGSAVWGIGLLGWGLSAARRLRGAPAAVTGDDLRVVAELPDLSRPVAAYVRALAAVADSASRLDAGMQAELLAHLNELVRNARSLDAQRAQLAGAIGSTSLPELESDWARLEERLREAPDVATRQALEHSQRLLEGRLRHARALTPGMARLEAQQEVVYQTLAAVEHSLRRLPASPTGPPSHQIEEIRRSAVEVTTQTRAVEEAVQEVLTLSAG